MNLLRRSAWLFVFVVAGALAGCSGEEGPNTNENPAPSPGPSMAPKPPVVPAPTKGEAAKEKEEAAKEKEMQPPPAKSGESKKGDEAPKLEPPAKGEPGKGDSAAVKLTPEEIAQIKKLPAAEQELAIKQAVCPVSEGHLGSEEMGAPYKVTVAGRTVFLCCKGCEKEIKADPQKFLAKLDAPSKK